MYVLEKCKLYKTIEDKFKEYAMNATDVKPNKEYQIALNDVYSIIKKFDENFNENNVRFKQFNEIDEDLCFKENKHIYFSSIKLNQKLNEEWKFWFFIKILTVLDKKIEKSYSLFNEVFKKSLNQNQNKVYFKKNK